MAYLFHPTQLLYSLPGAATMSNDEGASDVSELVSGTPTVPESAGSYVVVARRYRPRTFCEVIGQEPIARALTNAIETQRVGHAYLFTGARGVGKTSMARILAKALNAPAGPTVTPGHDSDIAQAIDAGEDVDVLEIDGASNRGIDEIRQLRSNANVRPSRARYKIYIIDEVHMLTSAAFNALLKTLEEPPGHVKFILCTTDPQKIPITVLSRCQRYDFAPVDVPSIVRRLEQIVASEQRQADPEALRLLARRAEGSMRDSQSLLEQLLAYCSGAVSVDDVHQMLGTAGSKQLTSFVNLLAHRDAAAALSAIDKAVAEGVDCGQFAEQLLGHVRDMVACQVGCGPELMRHSDATEHDALRATGNQLGLNTALAAFEILDHMVSRMRQSAQPRVLLEIAIVRICHLEDLEQLSVLISRLEDGSPPSSQASSRAGGEAGSGSSRTPAASQSAPAVSRPGTAEKKKPEAVSQPPDEPASPAAARQLTAETADGIWREVLERLGDMTADFASYYDHVATTSPDSLVVHFRARYTLQKGSCEQAERKAQLERTLAQIVGRRVKIDMAVVPDPEPEQARAPAPSMLQVTREKENDPFVRRAVELFDAEVVKVHVPRNSRSRGP